MKIRLKNIFGQGNMRSTCSALVLCCFLLLSASGGVEGREYPKLTTVNGETFVNVTVVRQEKDGIYIRHKSGGGLVTYAELPDKILKDLGLPTSAEQRQEKEQRLKADQEKLQAQADAKKRFGEEQAAKGLTNFRGKWMTSHEIKQAEAAERERAYIKKADEMVMSKTRTQMRFQVIQALPDGAICMMAKYDQYLQRYLINGDVFYLLSATSKTLADDEKYTDDLYWAGTYTYTTRQGVEKTVNSYSHDRELAQLAIRFKFGLFETEEKGNSPGSTSTTSDNPILADKSLKGFGSGFIITKDGYLLTNHHVVKNAKQIKVKTEKGMLKARVISEDPGNDIALVKIEGEYIPATFAADKVASLGQTVFTVGFPMPELQGFSPKVTKGVISSMNGIQDDVRMYQIDAAVQPGNSGGPLADENGNIVGIVVSRINDEFVAEATGTIAQNVNYAVKKSYAMAFVDNQPDAAKQVETAIDPKKITFEEAVERIRKATVLVMVY